MNPKNTGYHSLTQPASVRREWLSALEAAARELGCEWFTLFPEGPKSRRNVRSRDVLAHVMHDLCGMSLPEARGTVCVRSHSAVLEACRRFRSLPPHASERRIVARAMSIRGATQQKKGTRHV